MLKFIYGLKNLSNNHFFIRTNFIRTNLQRKNRAETGKENKKKNKKKPILEHI